MAVTKKSIDSKIDAKLKELYGALGIKRSEIDDLRQAYNEHEAVLEESERAELLRQIELEEYNAQKIQEEIDEIKNDKQELTAAKKEHDSYKWAQVEPQILQVIDQLQMSYCVENNKFVYCMDMARKTEDGATVVNPVFRNFEASRAERVLGKAINVNLFDANLNIIKLFMKNNFTHYLETSSFLYAKWDDSLVYNKARKVSKFWTEPDFDNADEYNKDFDLIMYCVGGGKQENIDHLEQWLAYKYLFPERVANTPNLDLCGIIGGNGKGRYIEIGKTIFTPVCVTQAAAKELNDGFTGTWEMATILYFDEPTEKELPSSKVKTATGGEEQRIERKGIDSYTADRNFSMVALSNNDKGVFKLAGTGMGGEDRRYSVISTDIALTQHIIDLEKCTEEQAGIRANEIAAMVKNRREVARWLAAMIMRHNIGNMAQLRPLHGEDYRARFEDQKSDLDALFDQLTPVFLDQGLCPTVLLTEIVQAAAPTKVPRSSKVCKNLYVKYLTKNRITHTFNKQKYIDITWQGYTVMNKDNHIKTGVIEFDPTLTDFDWARVSKREWSRLKPMERDDFELNA